MSDINIYCDESNHLEHDTLNPMILGRFIALQKRSRKFMDALER